MACYVFMERWTLIVLFIISIAVIAVLMIAYLHTESNKIVSAQCDKSKRVCQLRSEITHFGGYFQRYSYYYVPFPVYGPGLGIYSPGLGIGNPSICDNCLNKITERDEKQIINSKTPVSETDLSSQNMSPQ